MWFHLCIRVLELHKTGFSVLMDLLCEISGLLFFFGQGPEVLAAAGKVSVACTVFFLS